jgi:pimeloyl-ACP methyl ester carboxylesterase
MLGGGEDGSIDPRMYADSREMLAPGSEVEILARAGHFLHLEQPDTVAKLVLDWFAQ